MHECAVHIYLHLAAVDMVFRFVYAQWVANNDRRLMALQVQFWDDDTYAVSLYMKRQGQVLLLFSSSKVLFSDVFGGKIR